MRIAMISTPFVAVPPRSYGGTELVVSALVEELHARGHDVTLFATGDSHTRARLGALYETAQWPPDVLTDLAHASWALGQVADASFDVVHVHSAVALAMARLLPGLPFVYTLHHERDEALSAFYRHCPHAVYVAISADQARREIPLPSLEVIHHGLDPAAYACADRPGDYVCFVGRFAEVKGPHTAIDAAALAGVPIRVAGEVHPPDRAFAERELQPRLARPHVTMLGAVDAAAKRQLLRDARALLAPIAWHEPFGLILIEAMLSGCPVVAFGRGSVPELVEEGVTGFVVQTVEAMARLIRPDGPLDRFDRRRCRARAVERFSRARMITDYERCYARAVAAHAAARGAPAAGAPAAGRPVGWPADLPRELATGGDRASGRSVLAS
jgi:glycosyltransferase involved in cell wall biosynthesis